MKKNRLSIHKIEFLSRSIIAGIVLCGQVVFSDNDSRTDKQMTTRSVAVPMCVCVCVCVCKNYRYQRTVSGAPSGSLSNRVIGHRRKQTRTPQWPAVNVLTVFDDRLDQTKVALVAPSRRSKVAYIRYHRTDRNNARGRRGGDLGIRSIHERDANCSTWLGFRGKVHRTKVLQIGFNFEGKLLCR